MIAFEADRASIAGRPTSFTGRLYWTSPQQFRFTPRRMARQPRAFERSLDDYGLLHQNAVGSVRGQLQRKDFHRVRDLRIVAPRQLPWVLYLSPTGSQVDSSDALRTFC